MNGQEVAELFQVTPDPGKNVVDAILASLAGIPTKDHFGCTHLFVLNKVAYSYYNEPDGFFLIHHWKGFSISRETSDPADTYYYMKLD